MLVHETQKSVSGRSRSGVVLLNVVGMLSRTVDLDSYLDDVGRKMDVHESTDM